MMLRPLKKILVLFVLLLTSLVTSAFADEFYDDADALVEPPVESKSVFLPLRLNQGEFVFNNATRQFDTIDPALASSYYPGGRGANKLVIYTDEYGLHTGTNEFGTEAIVEGNIVTSLSGADSVIPKNGVVISGHGTAKNWITQNIKVGSKVYIDRFANTITVYTTSESYSYEVQAKINEAKSIMDYYKHLNPFYNSELPDNHITIAQNYLKIAANEKQNSSVLKQYTQEAISEANMAIKTSLPYVKNELKGVWLRPTEKTPEQIISTLDDIKANGFNAVFLETYFHGKTIFPSEVMNKYGFTVQNENFSDFDPLEVWISEAHKRGIKIHTWFQSFYVGNQPFYDNPSAILSVRPDWGNKIKKDAQNSSPSRSVSEHNGYFLDPANPQVHEFLKELINEIITVYKPDGINLDYIRYPNSNSNSDVNAWGFTEFARNDFQSKYGVDPAELTLSDVQWYDWNQYRRNKVTEFVRQIGEIGKKNHIYISAVIFPDIASALSTKQQDWRTWSSSDYVDGFTPLFLTYDSKMLASMMGDVMRVKSPQTQLYAGLFVTFMGGSSEDLIRQIYESRKMNADGVILFDYAHTTPVYTSTLMASTFKEPVIVRNQKTSKKKDKFSENKQNKQNKQGKKGKMVITKTNKGGWIFTAK